MAIWVMVFVAAAVLVWPGRRGRVKPGQLVATPPASAVDVPGLTQRWRALLSEDPREIVRRRWRRSWRLDGRGGDRRMRGGGADVAADVLGLLDAIEPALRAGLTPGRALELAASAAGEGPVDSVMALLVREACTAAVSGSSVGRVWQRWARESGSRTLDFVAAAWLLSERTGAPLADAVARAAARTRVELSRQRRVAAAVAGPRATVNVLTVLPLVGPLFGLASGLDPAEVYLSSPFVVVAVVLGVALILVGRWWCRRLIGSVLEPA